MAGLISDRRGVTAVEYALLAAVLGLVLVTVLQTPVREVSLFLQQASVQSIGR